MDVLLKDWSFVCVLQKTDGFPVGISLLEYDYEGTLLRYEMEATLEKAKDYEIDGNDTMAGQYRLFAEKTGRVLSVLKDKNIIKSVMN